MLIPTKFLLSRYDAGVCAIMPIQAMLGSRFFLIALFKQIRLLLSIFSLNGEFLIVALTAEHINDSLLLCRKFSVFQEYIQ